MLVLQEVVVYTGDVDALQHQCVAHHLRSYKLLLQLRVLYEIVQLVFSELGHPRLVEERIFHLRVQRLLLLRVVRKTRSAGVVCHYLVRDRVRGAVVRNLVLV